MFDPFFKKILLYSEVRREKEDIGKAVKIWLIRQEIFPESDLIRKISTFMKVPKSTLSYRISRLDVDVTKIRSGRKRKLTRKEDKKLLKWMKKKNRKYKTPTRKEIFEKANDIIIKRKNNIFKANDINDEIQDVSWVDKWVSENNYPAGFIFNMDETAVYNNTNRERLTVVTTERNEKPIRKIPVLNFHLTAVVCISNDGSSLPSLMIDRKKTTEQELISQRYLHQLNFTYSKSGYINSKNFFMWIKFIFYKWVEERKKELNLECRSLLILDNHSSHLDEESLNFCTDNQIDYLHLPPNSTNLYQPLDVSIFKGLKSYLKKQKVESDYQELVYCIRDGLTQSLLRNKIIKSFQKARLCPIDCPVKLSIQIPYVQTVNDRRKPRIRLSEYLVNGENYRQVQNSIQIDERTDKQQEENITRGNLVRNLQKQTGEYQGEFIEDF
ncbi:hypothetical protein M0812_25370 [Anaeramoeba flamelloides]|uniref:DDE-1 domain-containing protein n=1 Tax=Anaeramoeba flamelloides TaxID=1746091 RepID=A0AAV7YIG1_9EUKA|nr:hypothetical protein M0812_25370 [Anaeramoeba flamelloides]